MSRLETVLKDFLLREKLSLYSFLSLKDCTILRPYLLERAGISPENGCVLMLAVPYLSEKALAAERNVSLYAVAKDYHLYFGRLWGTLLPLLEKEFPGYHFAGFSDHSPIDEIGAAAMAGLGILGDNHLLITREYGSFIFLGELITDYPANVQEKAPVGHCPSCRSCRAACPIHFSGNEICRSSLSQKKGKLSDEEAEIQSSSQLIWGCDICQLSCPLNQKAIGNGTAFSPIPFFGEDLLPYLTEEMVRNMSEEEFRSRAYAWRGRDVLLRNLRLNTEKGGPAC